MAKGLHQCQSGQARQLQQFVCLRERSGCGRLWLVIVRDTLDAMGKKGSRRARAGDDCNRARINAASESM